MRILVLSFYYPPDLSAGSFRARALVDALLDLGKQNVEIDVLTTLPNRYRTYSGDPASGHEAAGNVRITRISLPAHDSGMLDQSLAFLKYAHEVRRQTSRRSYDVIVATSSRLATAALGSWIARRSGAKLYLDIRDIFVDTIGDVLPGVLAAVAEPVASSIERWAVSRAARINLVSGGFESYFRSRYPRLRYSCFTNGVDEEFVRRRLARRKKGLEPHTPALVVYAGNIGEGQGLHSIIPPLAKRLTGRVRFLIIGDGGRRRVLEQALMRERIGNVELKAPMDRSQLVAAYEAADVLFLHLNAYDAFRRVLPSKLFEYAAMGKPIWAGLDGYAAEFVGAEISNAAIFPPCDVVAALAAFDCLALEEVERTEFIAKWSRLRIMERMAAEILALAEEDG